MLLGALAVRRVWLRDERVRAAIVRWFAVGYLGGFATLTWQAFRGQSVVAPDAATLAALAASALIAIAGVAVTAAKARGKAGPTIDSAANVNVPQRESQ